MDKLSCMNAFCNVIKEGGFSAAARKMGISKVLVSRYVSQLESDLDVRLLHRTTRKMSPSEQGKAYYERCVTLLEEFKSLDDSIRETHQQVKGCLKISIPSEVLLESHLLPFFSLFKREYPNVELDIQLSDRYIDIVEEGVDLAIRLGKLEDSSLIARKLSDYEMLLCANPSYLSNAPSIVEPNDLHQHTLITDTNYRGGELWRFTHGDRKESVRTHGQIQVNSLSAVKHFLNEGLGIGLCLSFNVENDIKSGKLVQLLPDWEIQKGGIYAVFSHRKHLSAKVNTCVSALSDYFDNH